MPSKAQIKARKAFVKNYAKKGKKVKTKKAKSSKPKKSKFKNKADFDKRAVAGVDYYKDMRTLLGTAKKPKTKGWKSKR